MNQMGTPTKLEVGMKVAYTQEVVQELRRDRTLTPDLVVDGPIDDGEIEITTDMGSQLHCRIVEVMDGVVGIQECETGSDFPAEYKPVFISIRVAQEAVREAALSAVIEQEKNGLAIKKVPSALCTLATLVAQREIDSASVQVISEPKMVVEDPEGHSNYDTMYVVLEDCYGRVEVQNARWFFEQLNMCS
jgi:hypothetical protein